MKHPPKYPIPVARQNAPQPVLPALIAPHALEIAASGESIGVLLRDVVPEGYISSTAAEAIGLLAANTRRHLDAICEAMRLKVQSLDAARAIAENVAEAGHAGIAEAAVTARLWRRGFTAADVRPAILALVERGDIIRAELPSGKRGPKAHRLYWRGNAPEAAA